MSLEKRRTEEKEKVYRYIQEHPKETEDDIASALNLNIIDVLVALSILNKEGKVIEVDA